MRSGRQWLLNLSLVVTSVLLTYTVLEVAYRGYLYMQLLRGGQSGELWTLDSPLYRFDETVGYRYSPNQTIELRHYDSEGSLLRGNGIRTNAQGHTSPEDVPSEKPDGEWRIVVLGNSFTAAVVQNVPWTAVLERRLQADTALLAAMGYRSVRVVNLGMDGTGVVQWPSVAKHFAERYDPDLVIVNLIEDDIRRRFLWRDTRRLAQSSGGYQVLLECYSLPVQLENRDCAFGRWVAIDPGVQVDGALLERIRNEMAAEQARRLPWLTLHPELLIRAGGHRLGLQSRLRQSGMTSRFATVDEGVAVSARSLREVAAAHAPMLVLHHPGWQQVLHGQSTPAVDQLARTAGIEIVPMLKYTPAPEDSAEALTWFSLPHDGHFSDAGNVVYAAAVHSLLRERLISPSPLVH